MQGSFGQVLHTIARTRFFYTRDEFFRENEMFRLNKWGFLPTFKGSKVNHPNFECFAARDVTLLYTKSEV
jgi:hypothetical protein